jgi:hypothetical protein
MITQGAFNLLFRPGLRKDFRDACEQFAQEYDQFLRTETMDSPEIAATIMTGPNRLLERGDGEPVTYEDPVIGPKVMGVDKEFALGIAMTRKTVEDDQYDKINQASKWLGHAAKLTYEYRAAALLDDAFTGTTFKGIDGLALMSTAHTLINSSTTVANRPAQEVGLSVTGITSLMDLFQGMKDESGDPCVMWPDTLIVGNNAADVNRAFQIFSSAQEPFTAENQDNAIKKRMPNTRVITSHFKLSTKSYFLVDSKNNDAELRIRRPIEFDDTFDFDTDVAKYKTTTRFLIWFVSWRGWAGANPA